MAHRAMDFIAADDPWPSKWSVPSIARIGHDLIAEARAKYAAEFAASNWLGRYWLRLRHFGRRLTKSCERSSIGSLRVIRCTERPAISPRPAVGRMLNLFYERHRPGSRRNFDGKCHRFRHGASGVNDRAGAAPADSEFATHKERTIMAGAHCWASLQRSPISSGGRSNRLPGELHAP